MIEQRTGGPTWDKNTPASLLEHLAWDKNEVARHSVAANPNTLQSVSWRIPDDDTGAVKVVARGASAVTRRCDHHLNTFWGNWPMTITQMCVAPH